MRSYSIRGGEAPVVAREAGRRGGGDRELKKWRLADSGRAICAFTDGCVGLVVVAVAFVN
jgi:hypothetical protein